MLEDLDYKYVNNTNCISKDLETTKVRMAVQWQKIVSNEEENEFCTKYNLTKNLVTKTLKDGRISLRIAAALAQELSVNPYFLICDSDNFKEYSEEQLQKFLTENGYEKPPEPVVNNEATKTGTEANTADSSSAEASGTAKGAIDTKEEARSKAVRAVHKNPYVEILRTRIEDKILAMSSEELNKIESITERNALELLKSLYLRAEYDEEIKRIGVIVKLALLL
jgi:hypothetical protein